MFLDFYFNPRFNCPVGTLPTAFDLWTLDLSMDMPGRDCCGDFELRRGNDELRPLTRL